MLISHRIRMALLMRRADRLLRDRVPHKASVHMISYPVPYEVERTPMLTRGDVAALLVLAAIAIFAVVDSLAAAPAPHPAVYCSAATASA